MKGLKMHTLKKTLLAGTVAAGLLTASPVFAAGSWIGAGLSGVGVLSTVIFSFIGTTIVPLPTTLNVDPVQLGLEAGVLALTIKVKYEWDPEPKKEYEKAASSNGGPSGTGNVSSLTPEDLTKPLPFQVASLENVGIEAIGVGPELSEIATQDTRKKILGELDFFQLKSDATTSSDATEKDSRAAGVCTASYSICLKSDMTEEDRNTIGQNQKKNEQFYGTAGIAHAELGLKSVQQAIVNDGGAVGSDGSTAANEDIQAALAQGGKIKVQDLTKLIGKAQNTVWAMKVLAAMNLELAQRLNQGNMLQGSTLTIEAARAFPQTSTVTD